MKTLTLSEDELALVMWACCLAVMKCDEKSNMKNQTENLKNAYTVSKGKLKVITKKIQGIVTDPSLRGVNNG